MLDPNNKKWIVAWILQLLFPGGHMKQERIVEEVMTADSRGYNDICHTCNHVRDCISKKRCDHPVWFCEEFDNYTPVEETRYVEAVGPIPGGDRQLVDIQQFQGLCINCENRGNCKLAKPNGGIWHCQEYS
jgi:hypothetical protein